MTFMLTFIRESLSVLLTQSSDVSDRHTERGVSTSKSGEVGVWGKSNYSDGDIKMGQSALLFFLSHLAYNHRDRVNTIPAMAKQKSSLAKYVHAIRNSPREIFNRRLFLTGFAFALGGCAKGELHIEYEAEVAC